MTNVKLALVLLLISPLSAADKDFNGRWNLTVTGDARARAWWLEVSGAGSKRLTGKFVGAPGGQMDEVPEIRVDRGELEWVFTKPYRLTSEEKAPAVRRGVYRARIDGDRLVGSLTVEGKVLNQFTGERAPEIRDKDDGSWKRGPAAKLFNGRDLTGWTSAGGAPVRGWTVQDGILVNSDRAPDIVTAEKYWNFELHAEFRVGPKSNSGIALRDRYEVAIQEDFGRPLDGHSMGALYSRIVPSVAASKAAGEWQTFDIRLVGRILTVKLNGQTVIDRREVEGLTAMAHDPNEAMPGPLSIQGDHGIVEFRDLTLTPLTR
jgi:hypothetical protein